MLIHRDTTSERHARLQAAIRESERLASAEVRARSQEVIEHSGSCFVPSTYTRAATPALGKSPSWPARTRERKAHHRLTCAIAGHPTVATQSSALEGTGAGVALVVAWSRGGLVPRAQTSSG